MRNTIFIFQHAIRKIEITESERQQYDTMNLIIDLIGCVFKTPHCFEFNGDKNELLEMRGVKVPVNDSYIVFTDKPIEKYKAKRLTRPSLVNHLKQLLLPAIVPAGYLAHGEFKNVNKVMAQRKFDFCENQWVNYETMFQNDRECKDPHIKERGNFEKSKLLIGLIKSGGFELTAEGDLFVKKYQPRDAEPLEDLSKWNRKGERFKKYPDDRHYDLTPASWSTSASGLRVRDRRAATKKKEVLNNGDETTI